MRLSLTFAFETTLRKMKKCFQLFLLAVLLSNGLFAHDKEPIAKNKFSGRVMDAQSKQGLANASIYFADIKQGTTTNDSGFFSFKDIPNGKHLVEISFVGYNTIAEYVDVKGDLQKDFLMQPSVTEQNAVIVTGVSNATRLKNLPTPISIVRREELLQANATNLIDALSKKPGISQLTSGASISKPIIRGLGYNRIITLNDGVRQEGQQWGDEHGIEIDEFSTQKVELLKGPASLMYGSDALGGVINIITNVPVAEGAIKGNLLTNYQTNNANIGLHANLAGNKNGFNWNAYISSKSAKDYSNANDGTVFNSRFSETNFGGYIGYNGGWGYSHLILSSFSQKPGLIEGERDSATGKFLKRLTGGATAIVTNTDIESRDAQIPSQQINHFKITSDNSFNIGENRLTANIGFQRNERKEFGDIDNPNSPGLYFDLSTLTYTFRFHFKENNGWRTTIGINGMQQSNANKGIEFLIPAYRLFDIGGFVHLQKHYEKLSISGGLRFDYRNLNSDFLDEGGATKFEAFQKNFSNVSGSIGASYEATPNLTLKLNVARGFRAPSIPELASNGAHEGTNRWEYGNKDLQSETSLQLDAGLDWSSEHVSVSANLFNNAISNFIFYRKLQTPAGADSMVDGNFAFAFEQRSANLLGAELNVDVHPHPLDWLHFENTLSFVQGRFTTAVEGEKNMPAIPAARWISHLRGEFFDKGKFIRRLNVSVELDQTFKQANPFKAFDTETRTDAYGLINLGLSCDIINKNKTICQFFFSCNNVGDVAYQNHLSRLKYLSTNNVTGKQGVFNMGRNFSFKVLVPLSFTF
jgi:iron complex outermembrane recepter protein